MQGGAPERAPSASDSEETLPLNQGVVRPQHKIKSMTSVQWALPFSGLLASNLLHSRSSFELPSKNEATRALAVASTSGGKTFVVEFVGREGWGASLDGCEHVLHACWTP